GPPSQSPPSAHHHAAREQPPEDPSGTASRWVSDPSGPCFPQDRLRRLRSGSVLHSGRILSPLRAPELRPECTLFPARTGPGSCYSQAGEVQPFSSAFSVSFCSPCWACWGPPGRPERPIPMAPTVPLQSSPRAVELLPDRASSQAPSWRAADWIRTSRLHGLQRRGEDTTDSPRTTSCSSPPSREGSAPSPRLRKRLRRSA